MERTGLKIPEIARELEYSERSLWYYWNGTRKPKRLVLLALEHLAQRRAGGDTAS